MGLTFVKYEASILRLGGCSARLLRYLGIATLIYAQSQRPASAGAESVALGSSPAASKPAKICRYRLQCDRAHCLGNRERGEAYVVIGRM